LGLVKPMGLTVDLAAYSLSDTQTGSVLLPLEGGAGSPHPGLAAHLSVSLVHVCACPKGADH
jgi:hypothetical protein